MSVTFEKKSIETILSDLSKRILKLETGGRPIVGISDTVSLSPITLAAGASADFSQSLAWPSAGVTTALGAVPYLKIYVDTDGDPDFLWPNGADLSAGQKNFQLSYFLDLADLETNPNETIVRGFIKNNDGSSHDYYIDVGFTYIAGGSSSQ